MNKEQANQLINKSGLFFLCLIIVLLNIYIGSNLQEPIYIIQTIAILYGTFLIITKLIFEEKNILIKGKIDIFVLLLVISTAIPLIFKTYSSYSSTINFIFKYLTMYSIYIVVRNLNIEKKELKIIINTIIISSLIPITIAIDYQYCKKLTFFYNFIDMIRVTNERGRMTGSFGYPNAIAIYISFNMFNAIFCIKEEKNKKIRILYLLYTLISIFCIGLTISKTIIAMIIVICMGILLVKYRKQIFNKKSMKIILLLAIITLTIISILLQFQKPLNVKKNSKGFIDENFYNLKSGEEYIFDFEIQSKSNFNNSFKIEVVEINKFETETILNKISFSTFEGHKNINFIPSDEMQQIKLKFYNNNNEEFIVKNMKVNGKSYKLKYKFIPDKVVFFFRTYSSKNKSIRQRLYFYYDSIKILKENWLFGGGGNAWRYNYQKVQEYNYISKEAHSYPLDVWMSFGILGIISLIGIYITTYKNIIKMVKEKNSNINNNLVGIIIGLSLIIVHSIIDFDMSFLIILILTFIMIAIINKEDNKIKYNFKIIDAGITIVLIIASICCINEIYIYKIKNGKPKIYMDIGTAYKSKATYSDIEYLIKENKYNNINELVETLDKIEDYIKLEPKKNEYYIYSNYTKAVIQLINKGYVGTNRIEYIISLWTENKSSKFDFTQIYMKAECMNNLKNSLKNCNNEKITEQFNLYIEEIKKIFKDEYNQNKELFEDTEKNNISEITMKNYKNKYDNMYNLILEKNIIDNERGN